MKVKSKFKLHFVIVILILSGLLLLTIPSSKKAERNDDNSEKIDIKTKIPKSSTSGIDFLYADKNIIKGNQTDGILWNEDNIRELDGTFDSTDFAISNSYNFLENEVSPLSIPIHTGTFGSTDGGDWNFTDTYKKKDYKYIYLRANGGSDFPGIIKLKWGEYSDFNNIIARHVHRISLLYEVWPDSDSTDGLDQSTDLRIWAFADDGSNQSKVIDQYPTAKRIYYQWWNITQGPVFDRVKEGGYIKYLQLSMNCSEEMGSRAWLNFDFAHIYYSYHKYEIQVDYILNYGNYTLDEVSKFDLNTQMDETVIGLEIKLYNFINLDWDSLGTIDSTELIKKEILVNGTNYFNGTKSIKLRFEKFNYFDTRSWSDYQIQPNMIKLTLYPPDPPNNFRAKNGAAHILLTWDSVVTNGPPLINYNVYRGEEFGGPKTLLTTTITNQYNDTGAIIGTRYYYVVSATTIAGTSENSSEDSGRAYEQPFIEWITPVNNTRIILPLGDPTTFSFEYDWVEMDDAELELDYGTFQRTYNVWNKTSINIDVLSDYEDGSVIATLTGKNQSIVFDTDILHLTFVRLTGEAIKTVNQSTVLLGQQLYMILHDPNGDNSYSSFSETSVLSIGVGLEAITIVGENFGLEYFYGYCGTDTGGSLLLENKMTTETGFDFRYEIIDTTNLTSSQVNDDPDYIGPGYGDRYWGETWVLQWVFNATRKSYSNGTVQWENPLLYYGIIRSFETFAGDTDASTEWKSQNAIYNNLIPVSWLGTFMESGGTPYTSTHQVGATITRKISFDLSFGSNVTVRLPYIASNATFELSIKNYAEVGNAHEAKYEIYDDESGDFIAQELGIDERFGTYIFNSSGYCETSFPYEHNTHDYRPPDIDYPVVDKDSNDDGYTTNEDFPIITVDIFEENGIQDVVIWYSIDNGSFWDVIYLSELSGQVGTWQGTMLNQTLNTTVLWYIQAWDNQGNYAIRYNYSVTPFQYTVIQKPAELPETEIPTGIPYPLISIVPIMIGVIIAVIIIYHKKTKKK
ncbi:MAG: hypothetical protein ACFFAK_11425 [Promethearchaeota archaeon]